MGNAQVETLNAVASTVGVSSWVQLVSGLVFVADDSVASVDLGALGQVVVKTQTELRAFGVLDIVVFGFAVGGFNQELAERCGSRDEPALNISIA